jgi:hypothetical protein
VKTSNAAQSVLLKQLNLDEAILGQPKAIENFNIQLAAKSIPYSDVVMSQLIEQHFSGMLTYIPTERRWYVWNGIIHEPVDKLGDKDTFSLSLASDIAEALKSALEFVEERCIEQLPSIPNGSKVITPQQQYAETFKKHRKFRDDLFMSRGLSSLTKQLELVFSAPEDTFTNDQQWLVVKNGVFDLYEIEEQVKGLAPGEKFKQPRLYPHSPERPVARNM